DGMDSSDIRDIVERHRDRISHVHVNDSRFEEDDHVPFGSGNLDFEEIFSPLQEGWSGTLSLEVLTWDWDYIEMSREKL
ncbi:MAG: TIM barrel protein, partial [Candidatus Nanohaloarchaea archaeon]|nr:TIM barrel protein [Candidatus Nanohaloarchaea archaeon]